jgi:hypothetical protein
VAPRSVSFSSRILALLVHIRLRLAFTSISILVRPAPLRYRKSEDRGFPGARTHKREHAEFGERPRGAPPRWEYAEMTKMISPTDLPEETTPPSPDPIVTSMIGEDRRPIRLTKRARGLVEPWQSPAIVLQTRPHRGISVRFEPLPSKCRLRSRGLRGARGPWTEWAWQKPDPFLSYESGGLRLYGSRKYA